MKKKITNKGYGSIPHMSSSKKNQKADKRISLQQEEILTSRKVKKDEEVIVLEKVDGTNVSIININNEIFGVTKSGYDVRNSPYEHIRKFQDFLEKNKKKYIEILKNGGKISGEWMIKTHSVFYDIKHEPFIAFDFQLMNKERYSYDDLKAICSKYEIVPIGMVHRGDSIDVNSAIHKLGHGFHGAVDKPEGIVYRLERNGKVIFMAKHVREGINSKYMNDESKYNRYK